MIDLDKSLDFNPFEGDFGDQNDRVLGNAIRKAVKDHSCSTCTGVITKGERYRSMTAKFDGDLMNYRWCRECCEAMIADEESDEDAEAPLCWEQRTSLGDSRRKAQRSEVHS